MEVVKSIRCKRIYWKKCKEISKYIGKIEFGNVANKIIEILDYANKYYDDKKYWTQLFDSLGNPETIDNIIKYEIV